MKTDRHDPSLDALLADRATVGLDPAQAERLAALLEGEPEADAANEAATWERAAAAIDLALSEPTPPAPDLLARRVQAQASAFFSAPRRATPPDRPAPARVAQVAPWLIAAVSAAAALALLLTRPVPPREPVPSARADGDLTAPPSAAPRAPSPADARLALLQEAGTLRLPLAATRDVAARGATGDLVWNDTLQAGSLRIRGLAANDPSREQYQLWIFDPARGKRYPVDGGVFDIPPGAAEVVIPIDAKLPVRDPALFAITVERPGGVVVSARERIVLIASAGS